MKKAEETVKAMITEEQLKLLQEQQGKLNEMLRTVGVLEVQKSNISKEIDLEFRKKLAKGEKLSRVRCRDRISKIFFKRLKRNY